MNLEEKLKEINGIISLQKWFDFEVFDSSLDHFKIIASYDFAYGHQIETSFDKIHHVSVNATWGTDTSKNFITVLSGNEKEQFIDDYGSEEGFEIFRILNEDYKPFYIVAEEISFNTDKVYYYKKENLEGNERIADWVV